MGIVFVTVRIKYSGRFPHLNLLKHSHYIGLFDRTPNLDHKSTDHISGLHRYFEIVWLLGCCCRTSRSDCPKMTFAYCKLGGFCYYYFALSTLALVFTMSDKNWIREQTDSELALELNSLAWHMSDETWLDFSVGSEQRSHRHRKNHLSRSLLWRRRVLWNQISNGLIVSSQVCFSEL